MNWSGAHTSGIHAIDMDAERAAGSPASWLALTAPGMLVSSAIVTLALIAAPRLVTFVYVAPVVRRTAIVLLLAQSVTTGLLAWKPGRAWLARPFLGLLLLAALACGLLVGADPRLFGPGGPITLVVLAMGFEADGWRGLARGALVAGAGAAVAPWCGMVRPMLLVPALSFPTVVSVDTTFAGIRMFADPSFGGPIAGGTAAVTFPTMLSVETFFRNAPVMGTSGTLFTPALLVAACAVWVGMVVNLWRVHKARAAMAASGRFAW